MTPIDRIRREIAGGAPHDQAELKRMALRAAGRINDPATAEKMHAELSEHLLHLVMARHFEAAITTAAAERAVEAVLVKIERLSKPQRGSPGGTM